VPDAPENGFFRPAVQTAALGIGAGWAASALVMAVSGQVDVRIPARIWLVGHGSGLTAGETHLGIVPVSVTALFVLLMAWAARRTTRAELSDLGPYVGTVAATVGIVAAVLAAATSTDDVSTSIPRAVVGGFVVGGLGSTLGAGWRYRATWPVPGVVRLVARGAVRGVSGVLGASLVLVLVLLAWHGQRAADVWGLLSPSFLGGIALGLACLLSIPTLVLWAAAVLVGPGFALGAETSVDLTGSHLGLVPSFPTLAAVPDPGNFSPAVLVLGLVLPLAGVWAGSVTTRVRVGAAAGAVAGLVLGFLIATSGGGLGPGRMAEAGPPPVTPLAVAVAVLAASGAIGSLLAHYRGRRVSRVPNPFERGEIGGLGIRDWDKFAGPDRRDDES
jgi:hypothetical protein